MRIAIQNGKYYHIKGLFEIPTLLPRSISSLKASFQWNISNCLRDETVKNHWLPINRAMFKQLI